MGHRERDAARPLTGEQSSSADRPVPCWTVPSQEQGGGAIWT